LSFALDVADRVLVIENGEIVQDDARAAVDERKSPDSYPFSKTNIRRERSIRCRKH
jgi:hypothetical protein